MEGIITNINLRGVIEGSIINNVINTKIISALLLIDQNINGIIENNSLLSTIQSTNLIGNISQTTITGVVINDT